MKVNLRMGSSMQKDGLFLITKTTFKEGSIKVCHQVLDSTNNLMVSSLREPYRRDVSMVMVKFFMSMVTFIKDSLLRIVMMGEEVITSRMVQSTTERLKMTCFLDGLKLFSVQDQYIHISDK
jgi:hypothetical protein